MIETFVQIVDRSKHISPHFSPGGYGYSQSIADVKGFGMR
jgi:hypothetical protein